MTKAKPRINDGAVEVTYNESGVIVRRRELNMWSAHNEATPVINIAVSGPDDRGVYRDIFIDIKKLKDLLLANGLI